jgi:hypothetical protein
MLHAGLDLSGKRLDVCLIAEDGEITGRLAAPPDVDGLRGLVRRIAPCGEPVRAVIESMTGARFVHDTLEQLGWEVLIADAQKVKCLAPLACKTDSTPPTENVVKGNRILRNDPDLFWDQTGTGNVFRDNLCRTSTPPNLCR